MKKLSLITLLIMCLSSVAFAQPVGSPFGPVPPDNTPYNATTWNNSYLAPTQNAVRDQFEAMLGGGIDHGTLSGLADDDHPQYFLVNGSRDVSGSIMPNAGNTIDLGTVTDYFRYGYFGHLFSTIFSAGVSGSVAGSLVLHDGGSVTFHDDGNNTSVIVGPVADGTTTLGITGTVSATALQEGANAVPNATDPLSFFAATTSAQLAGVLSDETGTLKSVFSDSPTFTTTIATPSITPAANFELNQNSVQPFTSVAASAVDNTLYLKEGKVGIGTTAPEALLNVVGGNIKVGASYKIGYWEADTVHDGYMIPYDANGFLNLVSTFSTGGIIFKTNSAEKVRINNSGNVGIGTTAPNQKLTVEGTMSLKDQAAAAADTAGYGQIWVSNATPDELWFTDDAGTDTQISSHPQDAPAALYINGPGLDWIGKRVQKYLGVIFWQKIDGTITEETFDAYNLRRKNVEGHVDLIKRDWNTVQLAKLRTAKLAEVIEAEVASADAFEDAEVTEEVQTGTKSEGFAYAIDKDGKVAVTEKTTPIMTKQGTGKFEKRLKAGLSFDDKTGKFMSKRPRTETEVGAMNLTAPEMPPWMKTWLQKQEPK